MHYDGVFSYIGQFGRYQKFVYLLICVPQIFSAIQTLLSVFILHIPKHRCHPESIISKPLGGPYQIPTIDDIKPNNVTVHLQCEILNMRQNSTEIEVKVLQNMIYRCSKWEYDRTYFEMTYAMENNLVCERKTDTTLVMVLFMAGFTAGSLFTGIMSDAFGRKKTLMTSIVLISIPNIILSFVSNFVVFGTLRFISGFAVGGLLGTGYVIGVELVGPEKRIWAGIIFEFFWAAGEMLLALAAYYIRNWKYLNLVVTIPSLIFLSYIWLLPESPRWLLVKGRAKEAEEILQKTAKYNKTSLPHNLFEKHYLESNQTVPIWTICRYPKLVLECLVIIYDWMMTSMVFYGLGMNAGNLAGSIYVNFFMQSFAEVIGFAGCIAFLHKVGRKPVFIVSIEISGIACLATFIPVVYLGPDYQWLTLVFATIGKIGASCAFAVLFLYSGEIFPTVIRNSALGIGTFFARAGGMAAPYIVNMVMHVEGDLGKTLPMVIFGVSSVIAGFLSFYLPETRYKDLPESIEDWLSYTKNTDISRKKQIETESLQKTPEIQELQELRTETSEKDPFI
ncbi:organic cation transporter protein-like isoform X1 [Mytilus trossulus]|uniref:organic cation transporter protein-like isoform X1 n=2 Tax=Mytilus trossulus TaxID=6551 RepID=UPI00300710FD